MQEYRMVKISKGNDMKPKTSPMVTDWFSNNAKIIKQALHSTMGHTTINNNNNNWKSIYIFILKLL